MAQISRTDLYRTGKKFFTLEFPSLNPGPDSLASKPPKAIASSHLPQRMHQSVLHTHKADALRESCHTECSGDVTHSTTQIQYLTYVRIQMVDTAQVRKCPLTTDVRGFSEAPEGPVVARIASALHQLLAGCPQHVVLRVLLLSKTYPVVVSLFV